MLAIIKIEKCKHDDHVVPNHDLEVQMILQSKC